MTKGGRCGRITKLLREQQGIFEGGSKEKVDEKNPKKVKKGA